MILPTHSIALEQIRDSLGTGGQSRAEV